MTALTDFVGTWVASRGAPYSNHVCEWRLEGERLRRHWPIEAPESSAAGAAAAAGLPIRLQVAIDDCRLDDSRVLFRQGARRMLPSSDSSAAMKRSLARPSTTCRKSWFASTAARLKGTECP
jgi:hypothetical protein